MSIKSYLFHHATIMICSMVLLATHELTATTLISQTVRNGSFETGNSAPWFTSSSGPTLLHNSSFASDGDWYAVLGGVATPSTVFRPGTANQFIANRNNGLKFELSLNSRNGITGFDGLRVAFTVLNGDMTPASVNDYFFVYNSTNSNSWLQSSFQFEIPTAWTGGFISVGLQFEKTNPVVGNTYNGYLDNIVLQQVPEPSFLTHVVAGAIFAIRGFVQHRKRFARV